MASLPLANQVRQVYVASTLKTDATPSALGDLRVLGEAGKFIYFQHYGQGGLTATDRIPVQNIRYIKQTANADMKDKLNTHTVKVKTAVAGQVYILKVLVRNYIGQGINDTTFRYGAYKAKSGDNAGAIAKGIAADLQASLGLDDENNANDINHYKDRFCTVTVASDTITIKEVEQFWELPRYPVQQCPLELSLKPITTETEKADFYWAQIGKGDPTVVDNVSKKLAELEFHAHGWRGDYYRGIGYPHNFDTKYMVNLSSDYDVIDIHYFFQGQGVSVQQSEKEITLIVPKDNETILSAIQTLVGSYKITAPEVYPRTAGSGSQSSSD